MSISILLKWLLEPVFFIVELIAFFLRGLRRLIFGTLARLFFALSRLRGEIDPMTDASSKPSRRGPSAARN